MHSSVKAWVTGLVNIHDLAGKKTLEIGSANINGSVRDLFTGEYVGIDMVDGPGVDVVMSSDQMSNKFNEDSFDVVLCLEMLEHDPAPAWTMREIGLVLRPGGMLILTTRGNGFHEHNRPDLWRFMRDGLELLLAATGCHQAYINADPQAPGWLAYGLMPAPSPARDVQGTLPGLA